MSIAAAYNLFKSSADVLQCPICHCGINFENQNSLVCERRHCFDLSKHGYINFIPTQSKTKYTKDLFESRREIFSSGIYDAVKNSIRNIINTEVNPNGIILDAGCGEGFFVGGLDGDIFALDIEKEAVVMAAKKNPSVKWMVGDLANVPIKPHVIGAILNIFSPANYSEFLRVLKDGGIVIKVIPRANYLRELRRAKGDLPGEYSNKQVVNLFEKHVRLIDRQHLFYESAVTSAQLSALVNMTPLMFGVDKTAIDTTKIKSVSIDVEIVVGIK